MTPRFACLAVCAIAAATPALAAPSDVCALITPLLDNPPAHFDEAKGASKGSDTWNAKGNPVADKLNLACQVQAYKSTKTITYNCTADFAEDVAKQNDFFNDAVIGADFCMASFELGNDSRRTLGHTENKDLIQDSLDWYRTQYKGFDVEKQIHVLVRKGFYKSTKTRDVDIAISYSPY